MTALARPDLALSIARALLAEHEYPRRDDDDRGEIYASANEIADSARSVIVTSGLRAILSIARGRIDAGIGGTGTPLVWQRLAEDLDAALAILGMAEAS